MKKILQILLVIGAVFLVSACGKSSDSVATVDSNLLNYLVDAGCMIAKYNGDVPESEIQAINEKYDFETDADVDKAIKLLTADEAKVLKAEALPIMTAKCEDQFAETGFTPESFLDVAILPSQINK